MASNNAETSPAAASWREEKGRATRQRIVDRAHHLIFTQGFQRTTMAQIASAADVSVQTVYDHALSKEALFFADREPPVTWSWPPSPTPGHDWQYALTDSLTRATTAHLRQLIDPVGRDAARQIHTVPALIRYEPVIYAESEAEVARFLTEHLPDPQAQLAAALLMATIRVTGHRCRARMLTHPHHTDVPAIISSLRGDLASALHAVRLTPHYASADNASDT